MNHKKDNAGTQLKWGQTSDRANRKEKMQAKNLFTEEVLDESKRIQSRENPSQRGKNKSNVISINAAKGAGQPQKQNMERVQSGSRQPVKSRKIPSADSLTLREKAKKDSKEKQAARRFYLCIMMGIFVLFVMGWGICQLVRFINTGGLMLQASDLNAIQKVEDNSANAGKQIDIDQLTAKILDNVTFEAELNPLEDSVAEGMVSVTEGTDLKIYMGNGTYADELVVMTALNEEDAIQNQKNVELHLAEMQRQFNDYIPQEAKKIDGAVKIRCGCYVIVCVTNDAETAEKTINAFIKQAR